LNLNSTIIFVKQYPFTSNLNRFVISISVYLQTKKINYQTFKKKFMRKTTILISALFILLTQSFLFSETTIANWTFESQSNTATIGSGTITLIGSITSIYATGIAANIVVAEGTPKAQETSGTYALNTTTYPASSVGAKTAGIQIAVSTSGYNNIKITADIRHSGTSANKVVLQYTTNGTDWVDATNYSTPAGGDNWYLRTYDFSSITAVNNNSSFAVRYVTDFDGTAYLAAKSSSTYGTGGTIRFDNVTISGTAISTGVLKNEITKNYSLSNNTLTFTELPTSKIEVYTLTGSKAAIYEPAQSIDLKLSKGVYVLKVDNRTSKIMLK